MSGTPITRKQALQQQRDGEYQSGMGRTLGIGGLIATGTAALVVLGLLGGAWGLKQHEIIKGVSNTWRIGLASGTVAISAAAGLAYVATRAKKDGAHKRSRLGQATHTLHHDLSDDEQRKVRRFLTNHFQENGYERLSKAHEFDESLLGVFSSSDDRLLTTNFQNCLLQLSEQTSPQVARVALHAARYLANEQAAADTTVELGTMDLTKKSRLAFSDLLLNTAINHGRVVAFRRAAPQAAR